MLVSHGSEENPPFPFPLLVEYVRKSAYLKSFVFAAAVHYDLGNKIAHGTKNVTLFTVKDQESCIGDK